MIETAPGSFSTTLLCIYFGLVYEGKASPSLPRVYFGPSMEESGAWAELFPSKGRAEVSMSRALRDTLYGLGVPLTPGLAESYGHLQPDIWIQDEGQAIVIENKDGGGRDYRQEESYIQFLERAELGKRKRAFLYSVPEAWLPNREQSEWWRFVRAQPESPGVTRGIIAWDGDFAEFLCGVIGLPGWFRDILPNRVDEGKYLHTGQHFFEAREARG